MSLLTILLITAMMFGLLAFFEPCTIATHTIFAVRSHHQEKSRRYRVLLHIWLIRSLLLSAIFSFAVLVLPTPQWGTYVPSIMLTLMAALYLLSRYAYIPVPHLALYRLLPGLRSLSQVVRLGLTLPACTLPLLVVVGALAVTLDSVAAAVLAGLVFAALFTAPLAWAAMHGFDEDMLNLLNKSAVGSPYLSASLLLGGALVLLVLQLDLSADALGSALEASPLMGVGLAFLAGFVFSFNPVSFASIPVVLAYVTMAHEKRQALKIGLAFVAGLIATHVTLGVAATAGGEWAQAIMGRQWGLLLGPLLIVLGLLWTGWIKLRLPWLSLRAKRVKGLWGAFFLAIPFSVAVCPFCAPALLVILTTSAAVGSVPFGFMLLLAFALGRSLPILAGAWSMGWLESLSALARYQKWLEVAGGLILMLVGVYMLNSYLLIF